MVTLYATWTDHQCRPCRLFYVTWTDHKARYHADFLCKWTYRQKHSKPTSNVCNVIHTSDHSTRCCLLSQMRHNWSTLFWNICIYSIIMLSYECEWTVLCNICLKRDVHFLWTFMQVCCLFVDLHLQCQICVKYSVLCNIQWAVCYNSLCGKDFPCKQ